MCRWSSSRLRQRKQRIHHMGPSRWHCTLRLCMLEVVEVVADLQLLVGVVQAPSRMSTRPCLEYRRSCRRAESVQRTTRSDSKLRRPVAAAAALLPPRRSNWRPSRPPPAAPSSLARSSRRHSRSPQSRQSTRQRDRAPPQRGRPPHDQSNETQYQTRSNPLVITRAGGKRSFFSWKTS
jgi:hypothetical protein